MSLSNVDMHHKTSSEKEEFKAQTKPRSITQAELIDAQTRQKKQVKKSNTKPKIKEIAVSKGVETQKHYYSTAKTTPRN